MSLTRQYQIRCDFRKGPQDEGVLCDLLARQDDVLKLPLTVVIGQQVDIQCPGRELSAIEVSSMLIFNGSQDLRKLV